MKICGIVFVGQWEPTIIIIIIIITNSDLLPYLSSCLNCRNHSPQIANKFIRSFWAREYSNFVLQIPLLYHSLCLKYNQTIEP